MCTGLYSLTDERGKVTRWHRDLNGRVESKEFEDGKFIFYEYQPESGLLSTVDYPKDTGITLTQSYFKDGNLRKTDYMDSGTPDVSFAYDPWYNRVTSRTDGAGSWAHTYHPTSAAPSHPATTNGAGRLAAINGPWSDDTIAYTYDDVGRVSSRVMAATTYPNWTWTESADIDTLGRLKSTTTAIGTWNVSYVGNSGLVDKITSTTGAVQEVDYDYLAASSGRFLSQITNRKTAAGTEISKHTYTYGTGTEFGQIKTWERKLPNSSGGTFTTTTQTFGYDATGQVGSAAETGLPTRTYAYDPAGNRTAKPEGGATTTYATANHVNQIASATGGDAVDTTVYDDNGNLKEINYTDGSRRLMDWDSINRLMRLTVQAGTNPASGDTRVDFTYNAFSQRTTQSVSTRGASSWGTPITDIYIWEGSRIIQRRYTSPSFATTYYPQGQRNSSGGSTNTDYYFTRDHLGSVYEVATGTGASGTISGAFTFTPYGERSTRFGSSNFAAAYTGHFLLQPSSAGHQAARQLSLTWYRAYDPRTGVWLSRDPIAERGGINLYAACGNNPGNDADPLGLCVKNPTLVARKIIRQHNPRSISENREYGGLICRDRKGCMYATVALPGQLATVNPR